MCSFQDNAGNRRGLHGHMDPPVLLRKLEGLVTAGQSRMAPSANAFGCQRDLDRFRLVVFCRDGGVDHVQDERVAHAVQEETKPLAICGADQQRRFAERLFAQAVPERSIAGDGRARDQQRMAVAESDRKSVV